MLKIALCTEWFFPRIGGISSHVLGLASEMRKRGHEVVIITKQANDAHRYKRFEDGELSQLRCVKPLFPLPTIIVPPNPSEIGKVLKREGFDIVHAHHTFTPTPLLSVAAAKRLEVPAVLTNHTIFLVSDLRYFWTPMSYVLFPFRKYIDKADKVIAVSQAAAEFIANFAEREKVVVVPNGVDISRFNPISRKFEGSSDFSAEKDRSIILYVGRLVYRKGLHVLLKAMPFILDEFPHVQLLIAGRGYMESFLRLFVKRLRLEDHTKLLGFVPNEELPKLYNISDLFILPSLYCESFGITLLEAMASEKAIVASRVGGIPEVIQNGVTGLLFERGDERDLAKAVLNVLTDRSFAETLASNARKEVEEKYSWPIVAEEIEEIYKAVL